MLLLLHVSLCLYCTAPSSSLININALTFPSHMKGSMPENEKSPPLPLLLITCSCVCERPGHYTLSDWIYLTDK